MPRNAEVPPQRVAGEAQYQPFWLREKTKEMLHYGYKLTMTFPRKSKELADEMRRTMISMYRMTVELDKKCYKKTTTQTLDVELAVQRGDADRQPAEPDVRQHCAERA